MIEGSRAQLVAEQIAAAILSRRLAPGVRLGEQALAEVFGVGRTVVRQALAGLAARGMVESNLRRGWFVVQPSEEDTIEVFATRKVIEAGVIRSIGKLDRASAKRLREHVRQERRATAEDDVAERSFLLGDFHVCLAECLGGGLLAEIMRDLTARTTLIASLVQTKAQARESCIEHLAIISALQEGDEAQAMNLMQEHLDHVLGHFHANKMPDPVESLRAALRPDPTRLTLPKRPRRAAKVARKKLFTPLLRSVPRSEKA